MRFSGIAWLLVTGVVAIVAWSVNRESESTVPQPKLPRAGDPRVLPSSAVKSPSAYSNILPDDYVGPQVCAECHRKQFDLWSKHPHSCMNQLASRQSVLGDFTGAGDLNIAGGMVQFSTATEADAGTYWMTVSTNGIVARRYQVTRTVGSKIMQMYVGKQVEGPEPSGHPIYQEHMLPFGYWLRLKRWLPREYLDANGPEKLDGDVSLIEAINRAPEVRSYTAVCMNCHNTLAYSYRIYHRNFAGFLDANVAAAIEPLSQVISQHAPVDPSVADFKRLNSRLDPDEHLVTLGISCESCHFGGREHAVQRKKVSFVPQSQFTELTSHDLRRPVTDDRKNASTVLGICVQCHSGTGDYYPNGASTANSREAIDMHLGSCASQLRCVDCHEPHTAGPLPGLPDRSLHVDQCIRCHTQYADENAAAKHSGHGSTAKLNCLDCHMPRFTQGLEGLVRSHRICKPVEESMLASGSVNACNLCHLDKSLAWTMEKLEHLWGRQFRASPQWESFDKLDIPAGDLWRTSSSAALRMVAAQSYSLSSLGKSKLPEILESLDDPQPINRIFAALAVGRILGQPLDQPVEFDIFAGPKLRREQIERMKRQANAQ